MKKWMYLLSGIVIGAIVASSGSALAAQVKSLVGQKVTGEYTVVVNGKELQEKGAVIEGRTNAPVRALAESIGADLKVSGKTITITTDAQDESPVVSESNSGNKYIGGSKSNLETLRDSIQNNRINPAVEGRNSILGEIEILKKAGIGGEPAPGLADKEKQLQEYDDLISKATEELRLVNEALAAIK